MRITTRLSTAGESSGFLSMPALRHPAEHYADDEHRFNEAEVRKELANNPGITMSADDDRGVLSFTVELLDRMRLALEDLMKKDGIRAREDGTRKTSAERRFDRGKFAFVRVDIRRNAENGFRVFLSAANPNDVVGNASEFARIYAQAFADNIVAIADALKDERVPVDMVEREGCAGIFDRARRRNALAAAKTRHATCPNRYGQQCSPAKPECELFDRATGRCRFSNKLQDE